MARLTVLSCVLVAGAALGQGAGKALEYTKFQRPSDAVGAMGADLFGDQTDFYTGSTEFQVTDISIPGNSALPVELTRSLAVNEDDGFRPANELLGNWAVELPYMYGTFAAGTGWVVSANGLNTRCSSVSAGNPASAAPPKASAGGIYFQSAEYWHGYQMHVPGAGTQEVLLNHGRSPNPTDGKTYPWVTKGQWRISCLPTITGGSGEGFLAVAPDGSKYYFNRMVTVGGNSFQANLTKPAEYLSAQVNAPQCATPNALLTYEQDGGAHGGRCIGGTYVTNITSHATLSRVQVYLLATRVEDRFGNWVTYAYNSAGKPTAMTYMQQRYYDPTLGRFLSPDPVTTDAETGENFSRYWYANNNPYRYLDQDGQVSKDAFWTGAAKGAADNFSATMQNVLLGPAPMGVVSVTPGGPIVESTPALPFGAANGPVGQGGYKFGNAITTAVLLLSGGRATGDLIAGEKVTVTPTIDRPYVRPTGTPTAAQRASVQGQACVDCGALTPRQFADHKTPLVVEYYETGTIDIQRAKSINSVQPQCSTCSARQGAEMSRYSKAKKAELKLHDN